MRTPQERAEGLFQTLRDSGLSLAVIESFFEAADKQIREDEGTRINRIKKLASEYVDDYEANIDRRKISYMAGHYYDEFKEAIDGK